jgi:FkbM family methyltransferase
LASLVEGESATLLKWLNDFNLVISGVVHVGAHLVQERDFYKNQKCEPILWVEAIPEIAKKASYLLANYKNQTIVNATLWSSAGKKLELNVTSGEASSSSLFDLHQHKSVHPDVVIERKLTVTTETLDRLIKDSSPFNTLVLDTQGAELDIMKGGSSVLSNFDQIICELSIRELYKTAPKMELVQEFLEKAGFKLVALDLNRTVGWGDGLFLKKEFADTLPKELIENHMVIAGNRFTLGTLVRSVLIKVKLYNLIVFLTGKR